MRRLETQPEENRLRVATQIATGALRYFMLKFTRNTVIAFDFQEALSFEGETGPYAQYAAVRARNILRKLAERGETLPDFRAALSEESFRRQLAEEDLWQLLLAVSKVDVAISRAVDSGEPAHVARYAFQLAQAFNTFYHDYPVTLTGEQLADAAAVSHVAARTVLRWQSFAAPGSVAWQLEGVPAHRAVVHQATGMISVQADVSIDDSLAMLQAYAFAHDRAIAAVAEAVIRRTLRFD